MNSKLKSLAFMTAMVAMSNQPIIMEKVDRKDTSHLRKKCKSCNLFPCNDNRHLYKSNPKAIACEKYTKRK